MRDAHGEERQQGTWGANGAKGARRRKRPVDARLMELLLASEARMVTLLREPREARMRGEHQRAVSRTAEELDVYGLAVQARLTWREVEVWRLEIAGHGNAAIADALHISRETAKTHLKRLRAKVKAAREQSL